MLLNYDPLRKGTGYVGPQVVLEFGARGTGEPNEIKSVVCEVDGHIPDIIFPTAKPRVMKIARTFWEKVTAAHVYCAQHRLRGERYSRHWYDLAMLIQSQHYPSILADRETAKAVALHKSFFFIEKDIHGNKIDYMAAISNTLNIVPQAHALTALEDNYNKMIGDGVLVSKAMPFDELMKLCLQAQDRIKNMSVIHRMNPSRSMKEHEHD